MVDVKINDNVYESVSEVQIPLEDGSGNARFLDTSSATAAAENLDKGYTAYGPEGQIIGTKENSSPPVNMQKIGTYQWSETWTNSEETTYPAILGCVAALKEHCIDKIAEWESINALTRVGFIAVADEAPASTTGVKAILFGCEYKPSNGTLGLCTPYTILTGSTTYGGINAFGVYSQTGATSDDGDDNLHFSAISGKSFECATCTIYSFEINFP